MKCPKCEKENIDNTNVCEHCGSDMFETIAPQPIANQDELPKKKSKKKAIIAIVAVIVAVALIVVGVIVAIDMNNNGGFNTSSTKSAEELEYERYQKAKDAVISRLKSNLKNPDSLQIHSTYYKNTPPSAEEGEKLGVDMKCVYVFKIDYSAQNGFGGMNRSEAIGLYYEDGRVSVAFKEQSDAYMKYLIIYSSYTYVEK